LGSTSSLGVVLLFRRRRTDRESIWGALLKETLSRLAHIVFFIPIRLQKLAFDAQEIKNPVHFRIPGFW